MNVASGLAFVTTPFATAYTMTKRGITGYSDALRLEYGDRLTVTTVYPGYIKTPIHDAGADQGISLDGAVPEEKLQDAVDTMVRAVLGPPARDLATTRRGTSPMRWCAGFHAACLTASPSSSCACSPSVATSTTRRWPGS